VSIQSATYIEMKISKTVNKTQILSLLLIIGFLLIVSCGFVDASILICGSTGCFPTKDTLAVLAMDPDVAGKTVIVTSPQVVSTAIIWPADRDLKFERGGFLKFSAPGKLSGLKEARPEWFGAKADNMDASIAANNAALQAALNASKTVFLSAGIYKFSANLFLQPDTTIKGVNEYTTKLQFSGTGVALNCKGGYTQLYDLILSGTPISPLYFTSGTKAIYFDSMKDRPYFGQNLVMYNVRIQGFEILVEGNGFYWKFYNCAFQDSKYAFNNVSSNNLSFFGCKFLNAKDFIRSYGGAGPISLFGCSLERWSGAAISPIAGGTLAVVMTGCYAENAPTFHNKGTGLEDFKAAFVFCGAFTAITFTGNVFQLEGIRRVFDVTNSAVIVSSGNTFWYEEGAYSTTEYIYSIHNDKSILHAHDTAFSRVSRKVGTYSTSNYIPSTILEIDGYNPITRKPFKRH